MFQSKTNPLVEIVKPILNSNVEDIVDCLSQHWVGPEEWLTNWAIKISGLNKSLRDDLRANKNTWSQTDHYVRLAFHYYNVASCFNDLYKRCQFDIKSVLMWLEKSLGFLSEIPEHLLSEKENNLLVDVKFCLSKVTLIRDSLMRERANLRELKSLRRTKLSFALGDLSSKSLIEFIAQCEFEYQLLNWTRQLQNLILLRVVGFLEDSVSNPSHDLKYVTWKLVLCLSKAYFVAKIDFLGTRFQNTHEKLVLRWLSGTEGNENAEENIVNFIRESVNGGRSLQYVKNALREIHQSLSATDEAFVEREYFEACFNRLIQESMDFLKERSELKDRQLIVKLIFDLEGFDSLLKIPHPLNQMTSYQMIWPHCNLLNKEDERRWLQDLKKKILEVLNDYVILGRKELAFLEAFINFLGSSKETHYLEAVLNLRLFCTTDIPFGDLIQGVLSLERQDFGEDLVEIQYAAEPLRHQKDLLYVDRFRELLLDYFKPPVIRSVQLDSRKVLEVHGMKVVFSEVARQESFEQLRSCDELRIIASRILHVDENLKNSKWNGKNIVVLTNAIRVHDTIVWDVSGIDSTHKFSSSAGTSSEGDGKNGEDGQPGESGGNVLILVEKAIEGGKWTIVSQGGRGSSGQNGGDGRDGAEGAAITDEDFKKQFPPVSPYLTRDRKPRIIKTLESMKDYYSANVTNSWFKFKRPFPTSFSDTTQENIGFQDFLDEAKRGCYLRREFYGNIHIEAVSSSGITFVFGFERGGKKVCCQSYLLCKGAEGKAGGKGGVYGLGGAGGFGGEVVVKNLKDYTALHSVVICNAAGRPGRNGCPGRYGIHGKIGWDIGYLDFCLSGFSTWPKYYGCDQNSKIKLIYEKKGSSDRVWSPYRESRGYSHQYIGMAPHDLKDPKQCHYDRRNKAEVNRGRQSHAQAKQRKTISQASITSEYQHLLQDTAERDSLNQLYAELDSASSILLQQIAETEEVQVEINADAEISRVASYSSLKKQQPIPNEPFGITQTTKNQDAIVQKLVHDLSTKRDMPIDAWLALRKVHISKIHLNELWRSFDAFKVNGGNDVQKVKDCLLDKYRFASLYEISQELQKIDKPALEIQTVNPVSAIECLKVNFKFETRVSHHILGTLDQYLFRDTEEERAKIARYCTEELELEGEFLRSFILEVGPISSNIQLKACYDHYKQYLDKQEKRLIVFQESFHRLDHIYSQKDHPYYATIIQQLSFFCSELGVTADFYAELLALAFDVNIRVYARTRNPDVPFFLKGDFNPQPQREVVTRHHLIHVLSQSEKFIPLEVNWDYSSLIERRVHEGHQFNKILAETDSFSEKADFDDYFNEKKYLEKGFFQEIPLQKSIPDEKAIISQIIAFYPNISQDFGLRLRKISSVYIGQTDILQTILRRFQCEGSLVSSGELCCLVNSVLHSAARRNKCDEAYCWIVAAYPQKEWIDQLLIVDCELLCGTILSNPLKSKWATCLKNVVDKRILLVLKDKLTRSKNEFEEGESVVDCIDKILTYLSEIPCGDLQFDHLGLQEWPFALKERYWASKLMQILGSTTETELSTLAYYTMTIENLYRPNLTEKLVNTLIERKSEITPKLLLTIFRSLFNEAWDFTKVEMEMLVNSKHVSEWVASMEQQIRGNERSINSLVDIISSGEELSEDVRNMLPVIKENLFSLLRGNSPSSILLNINTAINNMSKDDIKNWVKEFHKKIRGLKDGEKKAFMDSVREEMLSVVDRAIHLLRSFRLRNTQRLTVLILLGNSKNTLAQVSTGEGKSLIVVALSILRALAGEKVDIITSSSVLAKRDALINKDIYGLFGINVSHNCSEDMDVRKAAYSNNQVVYGDLSDFQRDHLLQMFYCKNVLGDRSFETVVVDEVDSMLLDKGNNMLYLSHDIALLNKLESVYVFIWQWISRPCMSKAEVLDTMGIVEIREAVIDDIYGLVQLKNLETLSKDLSVMQVSELWRRLERAEIIDKYSHLLIKTLDRTKVEDLLSPNFTHLTDSLCFLLNGCLNRERRIDVPNCLKPFIEIHLDGWIRNAVAAYFMEAGEDYVVDVDRTGTSADRYPCITIIDKDTGTDQANTQWDEALHQFLQLKHGCKLSVQSLKAVFISNVSYFKLYSHLYGLTGTLGSDCERQLLKRVYNVDFVTVPTAKAKQFFERLPTVCPSEHSWFNAIRDATKTCINQEGRSVLIICETVNVVNSLHHVFGGKDAKDVHTYTRDYEEFEVTQSKQSLSPGHVIVATNLAGRGTDIKINEPLRLAGGLHVILTYLPKNTRVEQQAFGRAARCGDKGSGQLIVFSPGIDSIMYLKTLRDREELERITDIKDYYNNHITVEEMCFDRFGKQFKKLKESFLKEGNTREVAALKRAPSVVEEVLLQCCVDQWALWLDANGKLVKAWPDPEAQSSLHISLENFLSKLTGLSCKSQADWVKWVYGHPVAMLNIAKHFMQTKKYDDAISLLDEAIKLEPRFSECARYYKAGALGMKIDWKSHPPQDHADIVKLKHELYQVCKLLDKLKTQVMNNATVMSQLKAQDQQSIVQVAAYEEQQTNLSHLYGMFSLSIDDILGHSVMPESFSSWNIKYHLSSDVFDTLLRYGILKHAEVTLQNSSDEELKTLCCGYDVGMSDLKAFLSGRRGKVEDLNSFKANMKKRIHLPSREGFWRELMQEGLLFNEISFVVVDNKKLEEVDPSLLETLVDIDISEKILKEEPHTLFINYQQIGRYPLEKVILLKKELIELVGRRRFSQLKRYGVFLFNKKGSYVTASLQAAAGPVEEVLPDCQDGNDAEARNSHGDPDSSTFQFSCYDSVSLDDFIRNGVSPSDAVKILDELVEQGLIKEIAGAGSYHLKCHYSCITSIVLSTPVYSCVTKAILSVCFCYRIALQDIVAQILEEGPADLRLTSKPHSGLLWDLHSLNIVTSISVSHCENRKEKLQNIFCSTFHKDKLKELLTQHISISDEAFSRLIDNLICQKWLNPRVSLVELVELAKGLKWMNPGISLVELDELAKGLNPHGNYLTVERDKKKRLTLDGKFGRYQKTITRILDDVLFLSEGATIATLAHSLDQKCSRLCTLHIPSFGFKLLVEACGKGDFSHIQEIRQFLLAGFDSLIVSEEKKYTLKFWLSVGAVVVIGICRIAIGALITTYSVGMMTHAGNAFMNEGVNDLLYALGALRTGYFSWKDYITHIITSLCFTIISTGVAMWWSSGVRYSSTGNKLCGTNLQVGGLTASQKSGAAALKQIGKSVLKDCFKQVAFKTVEGIWYGVLNMGVDIVVENHLRSLCEGISSEISAEIESAVEKHRIGSLLERAYREKGETQAQAMVMDLTRQFLTESTVWDDLFSSLAHKIFSSVSTGVSQAAEKKMCAGQSAGRVYQTLSYINKAVVWGQRVHQLSEVFRLTDEMLEKIAQQMEMELGKGPQALQGDFDQVQYEKFKLGIMNHWKEALREKSGRIISQHLVHPLTSFGAHKLYHYVKEGVKSFYRSYQNSRDRRRFDDFKRQFRDDLEGAVDEETRDRITREYERKLIALYRQTRDPQLAADIIRENVPMDMASLEAFTVAYSSILKSQGVREKLIIVVEKDGEDVKQEFVCDGGGEGPTTTMRLVLKDNHYVAVGIDGRPLNPELAHGGTLNDCLYRGISQVRNVGMDARGFRETVAHTIENDPYVQQVIRQGWHEYGMLLNMYGGTAHPYERKGLWTRDPNVDKDNLDYDKDDNGADVWKYKEVADDVTNEKIKTSFKDALRKINLTLKARCDECCDDKKSRSNKECDHNATLLKKGWKGGAFKMVNPREMKPEDFRVTMYDTIVVSNEKGESDFYLFPVEMVATVEVNVRGQPDPVKYELNINLDTVYREGQAGPNGPHVGYYITRQGKHGPDSVAGHITFSDGMNKNLPHRACPGENVPGVVFVDTEEGTEFLKTCGYRKINHLRMFTGESKPGFRLEKAFPRFG